MMRAKEDFSWLWIVAMVMACAFSGQAAEASNSDETVYVSDILAQSLLQSHQGWGNLGIDTAAYMSAPATKLQIGEQVFAKGLGHHSSGELTLYLGGAFERFLATLGVQRQDDEADKGSVIFEVYVDDEQVHASDVMSDSSKGEAIDISVKGALTLRLVAKDAGDGWGCDMANWADARLTKTPGSFKSIAARNFDAGQFGRVVTFNPDQQGGVSSNRYVTFREDEVFLDADIAPDENGQYHVHREQNGRGCVGLQWALPQRLNLLELQWKSGPGLIAEQLKVQHWQGESLWQGSWHDVAGSLKVEGDLAVMECLAPVSTTRIRWILPPADEKTKVARPRAFSMATKQKGRFRLNAGKAGSGQAFVEIQNGYFINGRKKSNTLQWDMSRPKDVTLEYNLPGRVMGCQTILSVWVDDTSGYGPEKHAVGIGLEDVVDKGYAYIRGYQICLLKDDYTRTADEIGAELAKEFDVLTEVRKMPDQTLEQALTARVVKENLSPIMLSLACDNRKFIVDRSGQISFTAGPEPGGVTRIQYAYAQYPIKLRNQIIGRSSTSSERQLIEGPLPIPEISMKYDGIDSRQRTFVAPYGSVDDRAHRYLRQRPVCVTQVELQNSGEEVQKVVISVKLFVDQNNAEQPDITVTGEKGKFLLNGRMFAICDISQADGLSLKNQDGKLVIEGELAVGKKARYMVATVNHLKNETLSSIDSLDYKKSKKLLKTTKDYWREILADGIRIELPNKRLQDVIDASRVHCLLASRNEEQGDRFVAWGDVQRYAFMEGEANPIIRGLDMLGHHDYAQRALDFAINRYTPDGVVRLRQHAYTPLIGTAWHLWAVGTHYELTEDTDWLRKAAPRLAWSSRWVVRQTEKTKRLSPSLQKLPEYGLVPPGVSADWGLYCYRYMMLALYHAGLRDTAGALRDIDYPDADQLERSAKELGENILRAYQWSQSRTAAWSMPSGEKVPAYPTSLFALDTADGIHGNADMNRALAYDVELGANHLGVMGVLDPMSLEIGSMLEHLENEHFISGRGFLRSDYTKELCRAEWFNRGGFGKIQPYYGRFTHLYALRDDVKPFIRSYMNALVYLLDWEVLSLWEHAINEASWNKTHETGYFLQQSRMMLVQERGDELWLAPFVSTHWMQDGMRVAVEKAPTAFGEVGYEMVSHVSKGYIEAVIDPPSRSKPQKLVIRFRHPDETPIRSVKVNGRSYKNFDPEKGCVYIVPGKKSIRVRAYFGK